MDNVHILEVLRSKLVTAWRKPSSNRGGNLSNVYFSWMCRVVIESVHDNTATLFILGE